MKKALPIILLIALIGAVCAHLFIFSETYHFIVDVSVNTTGDIALVDNTESYSRVLSLEKDGTIRMLLTTPLISDGRFMTRPYVEILPDGSVLAKENYVNHVSYIIEKERIVHYMLDGTQREVAVFNKVGETAELMADMYASALGYGYYLYDGGVIERYEIDLDTGTSYLKETITPDSNIVISSTSYTRMGTVLLDSANAIHLHDPQTGTFSRLYPTAGETATIVEIDMDEQGNLVVWDENAGGLFRIGDSGKATLLYNTNRRFDGENVTIQDMLSIDMNSAERFVGVYNDAQKIIAVENSISTAIRPHRTLSYLVVGDLLVFAGIFIILLLIVSIVRWWNKKERLFPIVAKQLSFGIPAIIIGTAVLYTFASASIGSTLKNQYHNALYDAGLQKMRRIDAQWLSSMDMDDPLADPTYGEVLTMLEASAYLIDVEGEDGPDVARSFYYYWLLAVRDSTVVTAVCETYQVGLPLRYVYSESTRSNYERVLATERPVYCSTRDVFGSWIITLIPVYQDGEIVGILEAGTNSSSVNAAIQDRSIMLAGVGSAIMLFVMLLVMLMLTASLRPLNRMKMTMQQVVDGKYGLTVKVRSHDEIAQLGRIFNILSRTIVRQIQNLTSLNASYYRFVPLKTMNLLGGKDVKDVSLGDQALMDMTIMQMSLHDFDALVTSMSTEKLFKLLNEVHETFVPLLNRYSGVIDRYTESGWISLFTGEPRDAIAAGVDIMARLAEYNDLRAARGEAAINLGLAIARGPVMVGIVGQKDRVSAMAISEIVNMTQYLLGIGRDIGSRIIMADTVLGMDHFGFSTRWLGKMSIAKRSEQTDLYDCYDGDKEIQRMRKADTAGDFFTGVTAFTNGEYYKARKAFIDVLRVNPADAAATAYLLRCDEEYRKENIEEGGSMFIYS